MPTPAQQQLHGHLSLASDPLYRARRLLRTGTNLLTGPQHTRLEALFASEDHVEVEATWSIYPKMVAAYRQPDPARGKALIRQAITAISNSVPKALRELIILDRALNKRSADVLAYFDRPPHTTGGPNQTINGHLEHLRSSALGFRNLANHITRSMLQTVGLRPHLHPQLG